MDGADDIRTGVSVESESDVLSTIPAVETPSSSPSAMDSPRIELVVSEDDADYRDRSPPVAIIGEDEIYSDPMESFPYVQPGETLVGTMKRLCSFIQYGMYPIVIISCRLPILNRRNRRREMLCGYAGLD